MWLLASALALITTIAHAGEPPSYVGRATCAQCHAAADATWSGSHHAGALAPADAKSVKGDFEGAVFDDKNAWARFFRRDDRFFVRTRGADDEIHDYRVRYTIGVEPLQQYLLETAGGRLQAFTLAFDTRARRWFDLHPGERIGPNDPLHWTGREQNWNFMCADCHTTGLRKNYDAKTDAYATTWSEANVSCEACHGPGSAHVAVCPPPSSSRTAR